MEDLERIQRYISRTKMKNSRAYCMRVNDLRLFYRLMDQDAYRAFCLPYEYGRASGYREARAEARA